VPLTL